MYVADVGFVHQSVYVRRACVDQYYKWRCRGRRAAARGARRLANFTIDGCNGRVGRRRQYCGCQVVLGGFQLALSGEHIIVVSIQHSLRCAVVDGIIVGCLGIGDALLCLCHRVLQAG